MKVLGVMASCFWDHPRILYTVSGCRHSNLGNDFREMGAFFTPHKMRAWGMGTPRCWFRVKGIWGEVIVWGEVVLRLKMILLS